VPPFNQTRPSLARNFPRSHPKYAHPEVVGRGARTARPRAFRLAVQTLQSIEQSLRPRFPPTTSGCTDPKYAHPEGAGDPADTPAPNHPFNPIPRSFRSIRPDRRPIFAPLHTIRTPSRGMRGIPSPPPPHPTGHSVLLGPDSAHLVGPSEGATMDSVGLQPATSLIARVSARLGWATAPLDPFPTHSVGRMRGRSVC
jgi:hypothetical protein